jgi:site-specific recombinase XerD
VSGQEEILVSADEKGNPIRRQRWNEIWNRAATKADLPPGTTPHELRHFYASLLISKGAPVKAIQPILEVYVPKGVAETGAQAIGDGPISGNL